MIVITKKIYCDLCGKEITNEFGFVSYSIRARFSNKKERYLDAHDECARNLFIKAHEREDIDD